MRDAGDRWNEWWYTYQFAAACRRAGEGARARALLEGALATVLEGQHVAIELATRADLALLLAQAGDPEGARVHLARCREILAAGEDWRGRAGRVALAEAVTLAADGHPREADNVVGRAVDIFRRYGLAWDEAEALHAWSGMLRAAGDRRAAADRLDTAIALYQRLGAAERWIERLRADEMPGTQPTRRAAFPDGLTPREIEVLGLLGAGLSNREIAERLVVSVRTVGRHVDNIYGKIGVHERSKARRYAQDRGLVASPPDPDA
jgi:ATP/maltotriose-dependent transcriptional regulator MalT